MATPRYKGLHQPVTKTIEFLSVYLLIEERATQEDFAETFMLFVKHKGRIPAKFARKPAIRKKWKAVAEIVKRVAAATR